MEIPNLNQPPATLNSQPIDTFDLLATIRRLGGINATVTRLDKTGILLATRLGEIIGKNSLDLKVGDRVRVRVGGPDSNPVLKVSPAPVEQIILKASRQTALTRALAPDQPQTAMVLARKPQTTEIAVNGSRYSIRQPAEFKTGQLISLVYRPDKNQVEIRPVNTEQVLKSALSRLLPQVMQAGSGNSLVKLVNIMQSMVSQTPPAAVPKGATANHTVLSEQTGPQSPLITRFLSVLGSLPEISALNKTTIQQWAGLVSPIKAGQSAGDSSLENPFTLLKQLPAHEAGLRPMLQQWARQLSASPQLSTHSATNSESLDNDAVTHIAKDILKLVEQSLHQHQFQQTSLRYQQELQQPINLSLTIPLTEDQSIRPLQLKIREGKSSADNEGSSWDINLSFEFGLLGLITSHINLEANTLSTTFWASVEDTRLKIDRALPEFRQQLMASGFQPGQLFSLAGPAPAAVEQDRPHFADTLLDIRV